jgi:hypothetical protein
MFDVLTSNHYIFQEVKFDEVTTSLNEDSKMFEILISQLKTLQHLDEENFVFLWWLLITFKSVYYTLITIKLVFLKSWQMKLIIAFNQNVCQLHLQIFIKSSENII